MRQDVAVCRERGHSERRAPLPSSPCPPLLTCERDSVSERRGREGEVCREVPQPLHEARAPRDELRGLGAVAAHERWRVEAAGVVWEGRQGRQGHKSQFTGTGQLGHTRDAIRQEPQAHDSGASHPGPRLWCVPLTESGAGRCAWRGRPHAAAAQTPATARRTTAAAAPPRLHCRRPEHPAASFLAASRRAARHACAARTRPRRGPLATYTRHCALLRGRGRQLRSLQAPEQPPLDAAHAPRLLLVRCAAASPPRAEKSRPSWCTATLQDLSRQGT